jgi:hypothetical protein
LLCLATSNASSPVANCVFPLLAAVPFTMTTDPQTRP